MNRFRTIAATIALFAFVCAFFIPSSDEPCVANEHVPELKANVTTNEQSQVENTARAEQEISQSQQPKNIQYIVKVGDTLSAIFAQLNIPYEILHEVLAVDSDHLQLDTIQPGEVLEFSLDPSGQLMSLTYHISLVEQAIYTRSEQGFVYALNELPSHWRETLFSGEVKGSFSVSAYKLGLTSNQIANITRVLRDKLDFTRELKAGDHFDILVEQQYLNDHPTGISEIKAISFKLAKGEISAFLAEDGRFYDREGNSLERAFNRYPVDPQYRRITSPFNPKRKHPVTGRISPHNGTDFATPVGAPVYSTGDGKVIAVRNHPYAGKYLVIEHNSVYKTRYLHLSKFLVKKGQQVKRGQKIAISGATGRLTGPHLHFEVLVRNKAVDAMRADLPIASSLTQSFKPAFVASINKFDALVDKERTHS